MVRLRPTLMKLKRVVLPLAGTALAISLGILSSQATTSSAATKYSAYLGGGRAGISVDMFRPTQLIITAGDTVEWTNPYEEIHTITFAPDLQGKNVGQIATALPFIIDASPKPIPGVATPPGPPKLALNPKATNPAPASGAASVDGTAYVNSGVLGKDGKFAITFPKQGSYNLICIVHPFMDVDVQVTAPGTTVPTQAMIDTESAAVLADQLAKGEVSVAATKPGAREVLQAPGDEFATVNRFINSRTTVSVGDTVTWKNPTPVPHTVTFNFVASGPPGAPPFIVPEPQAGGPPLLTLDPKVFFPAGPKSFDGTGYVNSGIIGVGEEATGGPSFSLTFTKAGTYSYICVLHADQGMAGVIEVVAAGAGGSTPGGSTGGVIRAPSTGDAGLLRYDDSDGSIYYLIGGALLALAGVGLVVRARI